MPATFAIVVFMRVKVDRRVMLASLIVRYAQTGLPAQNAKLTMHLIQETVAPVLQVCIQMGQLLAHHVEQDVKLVLTEQLVQIAKLTMNIALHLIIVLPVLQENILQVILGKPVKFAQPIVKLVLLPWLVGIATLTLYLAELLVLVALQGNTLMEQ